MQPARSRLPSNAQFNRFLLLSWLICLAQVLLFQTAREFSEPAVAGWSLATTLSYAAFYLLPTALLGHLGLRVLRSIPGLKSAAALMAVLAVGLAGLTQTLLFADRMIYGMYGFHINGFVIDLVSTPGGIASLGASRSTELTATAIVVALILAQAGAYLLALRAHTGATPARSGRWRWVLAAFLALTLGERIAYGFSAVLHYEPVLFASERYPLYQPMTFDKFARKMGIEAEAAESNGVRIRSGSLSYPRKPLETVAPAAPLNIVWLVAESLRFDMLDPKIMPRTWQFSNEALRLEKHFSGGNMTQMGVFSMFYGLYGNNWFPMLAARRAPVLMDVMQQQNYQFSLHTSQRFTYPAFDKTVFANMRAEDLHPIENGAPAWQRDVQNIDNMLGFIDGRDKARPFMTYMFFESTHANYDFPEQAVIASPYLEDFNYITTNLSEQIGAIKNRYINAAHHVDAQIGRVIEHLKAQGLLEHTVVIVLGDHGEEFMERKRWGHSAEFNRFQTGTPGVIYVPGAAPRVMTGISSHLDIPATLLPLLGVSNPPEDYSNGHNLLASNFHRDYAVAADWNRIAYIGDDYKVTFPINAVGAARNEITDGDDNPLADGDAARMAIRKPMVEIMDTLTRFTRAPG